MTLNPQFIGIGINKAAEVGHYRRGSDAFPFASTFLITHEGKKNMVEECGVISANAREYASSACAY